MEGGGDNRGQKQTCLWKMSTFSCKNGNKLLATNLEKIGKKQEKFRNMQLKYAAKF